MMTITITEAFDLPKPDDIRAMGFVLKLKEATAGSNETSKMDVEYLVTPVIEECLCPSAGKSGQLYDSLAAAGVMRGRVVKDCTTLTKARAGDLAGNPNIYSEGE